MRGLGFLTCTRLVALIVHICVIIAESSDFRLDKWNSLSRKTWLSSTLQGQMECDVKLPANNPKQFGKHPTVPRVCAPTF